jgi:ketosteroid isomerase-like protein
MRIVFCLTLVSVALISGATRGAAQKVDVRSALQSMVDTERTFSRASEEQGTRESFLAFIADDGILFRPSAVYGKKWMLEHPVAPSPKRSLLIWQPIFAEISAAGDMGFTTGPWEFKQDINDQKPVGFGQFATVWKKQTDGTWKFVVDLGISNTQPTTPAAPWQAPENRKPGGSENPGEAGLGAYREALTKRDLEFSKASASQGTLKAFLAYSASDVRLLRNDSFPFLGQDAAGRALATSKDVWTWQPTFADVSRSGDLGYSYGTYELRSTDAARALTGKGNYLRFWRRQNGVWKVLLDLTDPLPLEEKKN